jgi:hypothetical protein
VDPELRSLFYQLIQGQNTMVQGQARLFQALDNSGGDNPFGARPRPSNSAELGIGYSGVRTILAPGDKAQVLKITIRDIVPNGYYGMATIHVSVEDDQILPAQQTAPNTKVVGHVNYQSGGGGGDFDVDLTRGTVMAVGATSAINITCEFVATDGNPATPLIAFAKKKIETTVSWGTSANPKAAIMTGDTVLLQPGIPSAFQKIPRQARDMILQGTNSAQFPAVTATFASTNLGGAGNIKGDTLNPNANGTVIGDGFEFVQFTLAAGNPMSVFPVYDLLT